MLERQPIELHARLATEIAIGTSADQVVDAFVSQGRIWRESEVSHHQTHAAARRQHALDQAPCHRRRIGQTLCQVVATPHGPVWLSARSQASDFLLANLLPLGSADRRDRSGLEQPELPGSERPLDVARLAIM